MRKKQKATATIEIGLGEKGTRVSFAGQGGVRPVLSWATRSPAIRT
jgi:hypothetical protein